MTLTAIAPDSALQQVSELAAARDAGTEPALENFAELAFQQRGHDLRPTASVIRALARECLSTAFSLWSHRMVIEYVRASPGHDALLDALECGEKTASIAMATAMQQASGLGQIPTVAVRDGDDYIVSGFIAWASNIADGTTVLFPARVADTDGDHVLLTTRVGEPGLTVKPVAGLLALGATRSASLAFADLRVPASDVIAHSLDAARRQRNTHLLLQSAFCLGLAERSLAESAGTAPAHEVFADDRARLQAEFDRTDAGVDELTADVVAASGELVTLERYRAAALAGAATRLESALAGGRGFITTTATNRRFREAAFLPVQSPSESHLRADLRRCGIDVPALGSSA